MRVHYAAVKARLAVDTALTGKVHDTALVDAAGLPVRATYVILYGGGPDVLDDGRLTSSQSITSAAEYVYTVRSVSITPDGVLSTAVKVMTQLIGFTPTVASRTCRPIRMTDSDPNVTRDNNVALGLFYMDQEFTLNSDRT